MSKMKVWSKYAAAYAAWIIAFFLWLWFILVSWDAVKGLMIYGLGTSFQAGKTQEAIQRFYILFVGIIWLAIMIVTENYFRHGAEKGDLVHRVGRFIGIELALIFLADATLAALLGLSLLPWTRWLILVVELVAAVVFIWVGFTKQKLWKPNTENIE